MDAAEKQRNYELAEKLLAEQNFLAAVIAGFVAMILAAVTFGIVKSVSEGPYLFYSILAAGIGVVIGFVMQYLGRGIDTKFALVAAVYALVGCMLGNVFAVAMAMARALGVWPFEILLSTDMSELYEWVFKYLRFADVMFCVIGMGAAAYFSRRSLTREQGLALYTYRARR